MNLKVEPKIEICYIHILNSLLFVKNLLFTKKLTVKHFLYTTGVVVRGNETELNWKTTGCYKILIKDLGVLPGNVSHINLTLNNKINHTEITFYGVGGQKEIRNIEIKTNCPSVLNNFSPFADISNLTSILLIKEDFQKILVNSFDYKEPKQVTLQKPKILSKNLKMNFEPFIHLIIKP